MTLSKNFKKAIKIGFASLIGVSIFSTSTPVLAGNENHDWAFTIQPQHINNYSASRYRQTTSSENPWKVYLASSGEGRGTITTFWLGFEFAEGPGYDGYGKGSEAVNVYQGHTTTYTAAYSVANTEYVALGAENNNYSTKSYWATGVWDEETW